MSLWSACALGIIWSCVVPAVNADFSEVCEYASCHQPRDIRHTALMQRKREHHAVAVSEIGSTPGTVRLLLSEMEGLAQRKGIDGLDPEEVEHIQTIKDLIADTIIPSILDGAEESRQELAELYEAMINCSKRATGELDSESTLHTTVEQHRDDHKECRERQDHILKEKDRVCQQFDITSTSIQLPAGGMPGLEADDAAMIQYLKTMNDYFCGRMDTFKDEWDECEDLKENLTTTKNECVTHQQNLEETWCLWMTELEGTCEGLSECWNTTASRFYERKAAIEKLVDDRKEALEGAMKVQCLWDAWEWDREPCTVNETKVKECKDLQPNTSAIEVEIPPPPPPHPCDTSDGEYFPCTEAYVNSEYASLDVSQTITDEMRDGCSACPPKVPPVVEVPSEEFSLIKLEHIEGTRYAKSAGGPGMITSPADLEAWPVRIISAGRSPAKHILSIRMTGFVGPARRWISVRLQAQAGQPGGLELMVDNQFKTVNYDVGELTLVTLDVTGENVKVAVGPDEIAALETPNPLWQTNPRGSVLFAWGQAGTLDVRMRSG